MKCQSCTKPINPEWQHCINNNICPFCGKLLMAVEIKENLTALAKIMDALKEHESYLEDYLFAHGWIKQDSDRVQELVKNTPIKTYRKPLDENGEEIDKGLLVQKSSDEKANSFFTRAEAGKFLNKASDMKEKAAKVKDLLGGSTINLNTDAEDLGPAYDDLLEDEFSDIPAQLLPPTEGGISAQAEKQILEKARSSKQQFRSGQGGFRRQ